MMASSGRRDISLRISLRPDEAIMAETWVGVPLPYFCECYYSYSLNSRVLYMQKHNLNSYVYIHTYIHTHIHTYTHTYIHVYIHTYIVGIYIWLMQLTKHLKVIKWTWQHIHMGVFSMVFIIVFISIENRHETSTVNDQTSYPWIQVIG